MARELDAGDGCTACECRDRLHPATATAQAVKPRPALPGRRRPAAPAALLATLFASGASAAPASGADSYAPLRIPVQMVAFGLIILAAHLGGRLCRRFRFSEVTGQIIGGALVGPYALHVTGLLSSTDLGYDQAIAAFHFFVFVFLCLIAFGIGEELHLDRLRRVGRPATVICLVQGATTWALMSAAMYWGGNFSFLESLLVGAIGIASAPAATFVLLNQLQVEGRLRQMVGSVVVLADMVEIVIFAVLVQILLGKAQSPAGTAVGAGALLTVGGQVAMALLLGLGIYLALRLLVRRDASTEDDKSHVHETTTFLQRILAEHPSPSAEILLIVIGVVSLGAGIAYYFHWPFLITVMAAGFLVANLHTHAIFDSLKIDNIMPVLNLGFFALIGAQISFQGVDGRTALLAGLYVVTRLTAKLFGTWLGCKIVNEDPKVRACLPQILLPQAGVGAVEAVFASAVLGKPQIAAVILPAIVFFEVVGVFLADRSLRRWRGWATDEAAAMKGDGEKADTDEGARRLLAYLTTESIQLDLEAKTRDGLFEEMLDRAQTVSRDNVDRNQALQVLGEREKLAPTGLGCGVAAPHCRLLGLERPVVIFGRHTEGVVFGGVDNEPCDLIMMIISDARDPSEHLRLLRATAILFGDDATRDRLRAAAGSSDVLAIVRAADDPLDPRPAPES